RRDRYACTVAWALHRCFGRLSGAPPWSRVCVVVSSRPSARVEGLGVERGPTAGGGKRGTRVGKGSAARSQGRVAPHQGREGRRRKARGGHGGARHRTSAARGSGEGSGPQAPGVKKGEAVPQGWWSK